MAAELIEIIESITADPNLLMWKFADEDKEIQNGAKLTVRESQRAMLLYEGRAADVFGPGLHALSTDNIPIFSKIKGWKYGFKSPYKADVYFFNTRGCSKTSVLEQQPLKNAVLQGFSLKNCKSLFQNSVSFGTGSPTSLSTTSGEPRRRSS
jgi:membrane protease subunit (stomatin/prohibitin family)